MPWTGRVKPVDGQRLSDHVALGVLTRALPPALLDAAIQATAKAGRPSRLSRRASSRPLGLARCRGSGDEEVMRRLVEGRSWDRSGKARWTVASQPEITTARARLGPKPLAGLFASACVPLVRAAARVRSPPAVAAS